MKIFPFRTVVFHSKHGQIRNNQDHYDPSKGCNLSRNENMIGGIFLRILIQFGLKLVNHTVTMYSKIPNTILLMIHLYKESSCKLVDMDPPTSL